MIEKAKKYFTEEELVDLYGELVRRSNHGYAKMLFQTIAGMVGTAVIMAGGAWLTGKVVDAVICKMDESEHKKQDND